MAKKDFFQVRYLTPDGGRSHIVYMDDAGAAELTERLSAHAASGQLVQPQVERITPANALSLDGISMALIDAFGSPFKGIPDVSNVGERFPEETEQIVRDLLVGAFEGGSNYWYRIESKKMPRGSKFADFKEGGRMQPRRPDGSEDYYHWSQLIPTFPGGQVVLRDIGEGEGDTHVLDLEALRKAWILLKEKYPKNYKRVIEGDWDAEDADVFLQLAVFGEAIYG